MKKILIGLVVMATSLASAVSSTHAMPMKGMMITKTMTASMCMKKGGMVKMVKGNNMCMMKWHMKPAKTNK